jgi:hypothetical protein
LLPFYVTPTIATVLFTAAVKGVLGALTKLVLSRTEGSYSFIAGIAGVDETTAKLTPRLVLPLCGWMRLGFLG